MAKWTPLTGISGYNDGTSYKPHIGYYQPGEEHKECIQLKESLMDQLPRRVSYHGYKFSSKHYVIRIYLRNLEIEWFGQACCKHAATAKAINQYLEE